MNKVYKVNEVFHTLQGEGHWTGRPAVFCRFSGCNLWSGLAADRHAAICQFCDTDFVDSTDYNAGQLVELIDSLWQGDEAFKMVVLTGGEPMLQVDYDLRWWLKQRGFYIAVETNGTKALPTTGPELDWVCVSPKTPRLQIREADELKLVYPQEKITPDLFSHMPFKRFWLSPMDGPDLAENTAAAVQYCLEHPQWRLNIQTHKVIGVR